MKPLENTKLTAWDSISECTTYICTVGVSDKSKLRNSKRESRDNFLLKLQCYKAKVLMERVQIQGIQGEMTTKHECNVDCILEEGKEDAKI